MRHDTKKIRIGAQFDCACRDAWARQPPLLRALCRKQSHDAPVCTVPQKLGVTYPQYLVLVVLWERGPQGVGELAALLRMDFGTLSPMLKRLETKGFVTRRRQASDERRVLVDLTPKGLSLRKRTQQMLGEFYCFLNVPLTDLFDLKDRLRDFVSSAGPKEMKAIPIKVPE